jgi:hypothetical protein
MLHFRGQANTIRGWPYKKKMEYDMKLMEELKENYDLVNKMFIICMDKGLKLIMENPYSEEHFLRRYWCYPPAIIDRDRRKNGDYYKKPTQYFFLNIEPKGNMVFKTMTDNAMNVTDANRQMRKKDWEHFANNRQQARSMIHPEYANRFIREQILGETYDQVRQGQQTLFQEP